MNTTWTLLIYTVPAQPSRLRARVWREVKKVGAAYLRDGVCILPGGDHTTSALERIADQIESLGGDAIVVSGARLDAGVAKEVVGTSRTARTAEYAELTRDVRSFLNYLQLETRHRKLGRVELARLERDLGKLRAWLKEVRFRDYFEANGRDGTEALLDECTRELASISERTEFGGRAA